jgi:hypothetical protein
LLPEGPSVLRYKETRETRDMQWKIEISYQLLLITYIHADYHVKGLLDSIQFYAIDLYPIHAGRK